MSIEQRIMRILTANQQTLAKIDAILNGKDSEVMGLDADCRLCTFTEAAKMLKVSRPTIYRLARIGRLDVVPLNGVTRIRVKSVIDFANGMNH